MGAVPDWYITVRSARYLGVAPWDLIEKSRQWTMWAAEAESAEAVAKANQSRGPHQIEGFA